MNTQKLHDGFQTELIRRGLPVEYASGAAEELADHHRDVVEELRATGLDNSAADTEAANRLGDRRQLVRKSVCEFQRRHWCGRWPLATFLLGAPAALFFSWIVFWFFLFLVTKIDPTLFAPISADGRISLFERSLFLFLWVVPVILLPSLVAMTAGRLANRSALRWAWPALSCTILGLMAGVWRFNLDEEKLMGTIGLTIGFLGNFSMKSWLQGYFTQPWQVLQLMLPIVICTAMMAGSVSRRRIGTVV